MKLLLDTRLLLWAAAQPDRLSQKARALIADMDNELLFSVASLWEVAIKRGLDRDDFLVVASLQDNGYVEMPITGAHAVAVYGLPPIHKDPFDRILVAQSMIEGITLLTV